MQKEVLNDVIKKEGLSPQDVDFIFAGDLLNQCAGSNFSVRDTPVQFFGLYGACSTMAEGTILAAMTVDGGFANRAIALTSSHFCSAERQFRFPLEYGNQRTPTSQWTVTGSGCVMLSKENDANKPKIKDCCPGVVCDMGITDMNNMGAAMAPAAALTLKRYLDDTKTKPEDYDLIVTGDLGQLGKDVLLTLSQQQGLCLGGKLADCGTIVFDLLNQDVHSGGSGCGCSAVTLCSYLLPRLQSGKLKRILFCGTGALLSPTSTQQGLPIPGVCHAVAIHGG